MTEFVSDIGEIGRRRVMRLTHARRHTTDLIDSFFQGTNEEAGRLRLADARRALHAFNTRMQTRSTRIVRESAPGSQPLLHFRESY